MRATGLPVRSFQNGFQRLPGVGFCSDLLLCLPAGLRLSFTLLSAAMSLAVMWPLFQAGGHGGCGRARQDQRRLPGPGAGQSLWPHGCPVLEEEVGGPHGGRAEETAAASAESAVG